MLHSLTSAEYIKQVVKPGLNLGAIKAGKDPSDMDISGGGFIITGPNASSIREAQAEVRRRIAFYASTRTYFPVLECHGFEEIGQQLHQMSLKGEWSEMAELVSDDMLDAFSVSGEYDEIASKFIQRYGDLLDEVNFAVHTSSTPEEAQIRKIIRQIQESYMRMQGPIEVRTPEIQQTSRPFKRDNESEETYRLKWAAWEWLYTVASCRNIGVEVRLEGPGGRVVDLAAVGPGNTVYVVEVKASRSDFARDDHTKRDLAALMSQRREYVARTGLAKDTLVQAAAFAKKVCPEAWLEVDAYRQALVGYRRMVWKERAHKDRVAAFSIKFHDDRFMGIADYHYIIAPRDVVNRRSLPPLWGLLNDTPRAVVEAPKKPVRKNTGIVSNVLRAISRSNTTSMMRAQGALFTQDGAEFPIHSKASDPNGG